MFEPAASVAVAMRDGVRLATDVFLPAGRGPWPAVLIRHPYPSCEPFLAPAGHYLADRGYATAVQIVRGKDRSEGRPEPFVHDAGDASDTLDWIEGQRWSDGRVAMFGDSYFGFTQWAAAATGHRALRALAPRMTSSDIGGDWMYHGGAFNLGPMAEWAAITWAARELGELAADWSVRPLGDVVPVPALAAWRTRGPSNPSWRQGIYGSHALPPTRVFVPVLHRGGWWDPFQRGQIADWQLAARTSRHAQQLVMDATDHYDDAWSPNTPVADMLADVEAFLPYLPRYLDETIAFFDVHVRGRDGRAAALPVRWRLANGPWRTAETWPPPESRRLDLHLTSGGDLARRPDGRARAVGWTHDPADLVPSLADPWRPLLDLQDERASADRADVLAFATEPFAAPLDLAGPATALVRAGSSAPSMQLVARLLDVLPDGRALRIAEGVAQAPVTADATFAVDLGQLGYRLSPGHRLRLDIASSSFPRYLPYPGHDGDPWTTERWEPNLQTLRAGGPSGSLLRLAVAP